MSEVSTKYDFECVYFGSGRPSVFESDGGIVISYPGYEDVPGISGGKAREIMSA